jgi:hypothetical protein
MSASDRPAADVDRLQFSWPRYNECDSRRTVSGTDTGGDRPEYTGADHGFANYPAAVPDSGADNHLYPHF